jgi:hypothetical protein
MVLITHKKSGKAILTIKRQAKLVVFILLRQVPEQTTISKTKESEEEKGNKN